MWIYRNQVPTLSSFRFRSQCSMNQKDKEDNQTKKYHNLTTLYKTISEREREREHTVRETREWTKYSERREERGGEEGMKFGSEQTNIEWTVCVAS